MSQRGVTSSDQEIFFDHKNASAQDVAVLIGDKYIDFDFAPGQIEMEPALGAGQKYSRCLYPTGVALWALCRLFDLTGRAKYIDFVDQSFDFCGGDWVERRTRLVEQNNLGASGDSTSNA